ncbi:hypothetical protein [Phycisphaera mikurensis]|uniref:Uncharacterized protein n=1 Tax=Phycisphaera mikurensis (strain NBRC 102666 / KCTC 22515 / FYK2301M01) TaxID=1142394 RepID=I0IAU6_PHYMF|nr:hypothetical protein [Phycisphaera mikurensis]MBB6442641.1 hypothetical protein [Phycisphaera mikurensis]BAM02384.1 hypothetical protein PSMK_02250 [Phycisphaera mikurensis NBRC 102666]
MLPTPRRLPLPLRPVLLACGLAATGLGLPVAGCTAADARPAAPPEPPAPAERSGDAGAPGSAAVDRAAAAMRAAGWRVDHRGESLVRSRPRPVPTLLEPLRRGGGGVALAAAGTLGELRDVATIDLSAGPRPAIEVWTERARRPSRRLVIRSSGGVFNDAGSAARDRGDASDPLPGGDTPPTGESRPPEGFFSATRPGGAGPAAGAAGLRWDRWKRNPAAESALRRALGG